MTVRRGPVFRPFASGGRRTIVAILVTFALFSTLSVVVSIRATARSRHQASALEIAARQRMLAERYVSEVLLTRAGEPADPAATGRLLAESAAALARRRHRPRRRG